MSEELSVCARKVQLRRELLERRRGQSAEQLVALSAAITQALVDSSVWREARALAAFVGVRKEVDTSDLIERSLAAGKTVWLPRITAPGELQFWPCESLAGLERGQMGLREPPIEGPGMLALGPSVGIDLILVPGLGFDRCGARIGFGAGYYDRALSKALALGEPHAPRVGVCPERFVCDRAGAIPLDAHDIDMTHLLTEHGLDRCQARAGLGSAR